MSFAPLPVVAVWFPLKVPLTKRELSRWRRDEGFGSRASARQIPPVSGESAKRALDLAFEITRQIAAAEVT